MDKACKRIVAAHHGHRIPSFAQGGRLGPLGFGPMDCGRHELCACGQHPERCVCDPAEKRRHRRKVSAPLLERFPIQLDLGGHDVSECPKDWNACMAWIQDAHVPPDTWTEAAMQLAHTMEKHAMMSKRVHHHLRRLAAGHALWEGRERILTDDVQAAFEVLWMNRSGWWGSP